MNVKEIYINLVKSKRPIDFFGKGSSLDIIRNYKNIAKFLSMSFKDESEEYISNEALIILNRLFNIAIYELENGTYENTNIINEYNSRNPIFKINIKDTTYKFYENIFKGEVASIYRGIVRDELIYLKLAQKSCDNDLISQEYDILSSLNHQSLPHVENKIKLDGKNAILMWQVNGNPMNDIITEYPNGVPPMHVMWMLERMLSVVGYLHINLIVHGNIKPENIIINKANHNVSLLGFSFAIKDANTDDAHYKIVNDIFSAPEVNATAKVNPSSDIYSIGKIAIKLLGGDVFECVLPECVDCKIKDFILKMTLKDVSKRPNDAWMLCNELKLLRDEVYGKERFCKLD